MDSDPAQTPSWGRQILRTLRRVFVSGILVVVPVTVTLFVLYFLFQKIDGLLSPLFVKYLGFSLPGMGFLATLLLIFVAGVIARNVIGGRLFGLGELIFVRTPLVRAVYTAAKQLLEAVTSTDRKAFSRAVMIEYPRPGVYTIGFASAEPELRTGNQSQSMIAIFVPSTPTPVTGFVVLLPASEVHELQMTTEEAIKYIVSGGFAAPPVITRSVTSMSEA
jgi:uncharacterized membrane protein